MIRETELPQNNKRKDHCPECMLNLTEIVMNTALAHTQKSRAMTIAAGVIGNVLEWYDFAIYGFFAPILGKLFFPSEDPTTSLIASVFFYTLFVFSITWLANYVHEPRTTALQFNSINLMITEMFPRHIRVSAVSVGYNLTYALFGGTVPMIAVWLIRKEHNDLSFVWYLMTAGIVSLGVAFFLSDRGQEELPA